MKNYTIPIYPSTGVPTLNYVPIIHNVVYMWTLLHPLIAAYNRKYVSR